ncbi:MAG: hypothetical protein KC445_11405 [Anaerolineales bacterium]|nr:hypothetical protein [Anaerolineales bacterium]
MKLIFHSLNKTVRLSIFGKIVDVPIVILLIVIGLVFASILTKQLLLQGQWRTLVHDGYGFSIDYPASWSADKYGDSGWRGVVYARAQLIGSGSRIFIHQQTMDNPQLTDAVRWGQEILDRKQITEQSSLVEIQIGDGKYPALMQTYKEDVFVDITTNKAIYLVTDNSAFLIQLSDINEKSESIIDQMLASFRLYSGEND